MNNTKKRSLLALTECSIMIALSTVLSIIKVIELPYGGSVTMASMLPIAVAVYRHGGVWGLGTALVNAVIQMLLELNNFSWFTTWQSIVALALFDYIIAFAAFALVGIFKKIEKRQNIAMALGVLLCSVIRYLCHVISGATIWAGLSIPSEAAIIYSLSYNATYMIPETVILTLATAYVFSVIDFKSSVPRRIKAQALDKVSAFMYIGAGAVILGGLIADTAIVFSKLQNADSGEFSFSGISEVNFIALTIVSVAAILVSAGLFLAAKLRAKEAAV